MSTMKSAQTVYYGPSTSIYPSVGSVSSGETVTALWKEGDWTHIEYSVTGTSKKKRGYVRTDTVNITESVSTITVQNYTRYVLTSATTYTGPGSTGYVEAGSVSRGETVIYLGQKINNYAFIEYTITGTSQKKRAYFYADYLTATPITPQLVVGERPSDMNIYGECYFSKNWYYQSDPTLVGQCTWFCWGRALEKCGRSIRFNGDNNAKNWYSNAISGYSSKQPSTVYPMKNAIACFSDSKNGHVVFIEDVVGSTVYYTEANADRNNELSDDDGIVKIASTTDFPSLYGKTLVGYIVL
ncbi:hypothetical protein CDQ84_18535 [Clostridium thermosuccinogenes]|uniref:N-acetylmuramoyl-L-alanine amidase n=1 Tax=Clostridium thermosuccinogenes TaxID=84032 RepID=A0A2K2EZE3_9CLOT|nr:CHAP domain-containing protein [Pseudoclostridium thermosuccinogenes]AUS98017.1 hypothetical protein CDO33_17120 [Pseudoclostridium thermosuccinogenes]PNT91887.1 hypothetical protein CDQ85_18460 [Pseudoclostridium thermosuccinogenes]PNT94674.1 hypothetical protein CDQ84_18535 [Pseudoclostridium thermosuccinogenes]